MSNLINIIQKVVAPLKRSITLMISRAVVALANDSTGIQSLQALGLSEELLDSVERFQQYGFTSVPLPGSEAILVFPSGNREHAIATNVDDRRFRPIGLLPGETCLYDFYGNQVILKANQIEITHLLKTILDSPLVDIGKTGLESPLNGETFQTFFNAHTHLDSFGIPTGSPIIPSNPLHLSLSVKVAKF